MADDELIDLLQKPKDPEPDFDEAEPTPAQRSGWAFVLTLACFIPIGILFNKLANRPYGIQIAILVTDTFLIFYIASNRFLNPVPWDLLSRCRRRFLLGHAVALAVVYCITTWALAVKPHLPTWFVVSGRKGSLFDLCLIVILILLGFYEYSWLSRQEKKQASRVEER